MLVLIYPFHMHIQKWVQPGLNNPHVTQIVQRDHMKGSVGRTNVVNYFTNMSGQKISG